MDKKGLLQSDKYKFIEQNPDFNICYLVMSGSHGYGTNNDDSDIDLRGFLIENEKYLLGLSRFEQFEDIPTDTVIYSLKKFVSLCANANPNVLELLGVDSDNIVIMTEHGRLIRENAHIFLSKRAINSFGEYATAQLRRLQNALCHDAYTAEQQDKHLLQTFTSELRHFNETYTSFANGAIEIYVDETQNGSGLFFDVNLKRYPVKDFVGIYSEMNSTIKVYNKLNHRNRKKESKGLFKHAMHLIRLLITGTDILNGKGIITKRVDEHRLLMDLRNGVYSFDEIFKMTDEFQAKFNEAAKNTNLPDKPDMAAVELLVIDIYKRVLFS